MLERVAVLSDIHGVQPALAAVLAEPEVAAADRIVVTGDIAAGPQPVEVLDQLAELGERVVWVRGNADRELVAARAGIPPSIPDAIAGWAAGQLRADQLTRLAGLPTAVTLTIRGLGPVLFCHATPRDDEEVVLVDSRLDRWAEVMPDGTPMTVVCGHTHMPYVRLAHGRLVVNPGSVGMPYGRSGAHWALLGPGVTLRRTEYDLDAACAEVTAASGYPEVATWVDFFLRARGGDALALRVFGPRDGRYPDGRVPLAAAEIDRLRRRGCWSEAAALLPATGFDPVLLRAGLLTEAALFTLTGWAQARAAVEAAGSLADTDERRGRLALERGYLAYAEALGDRFATGDEAGAATEARAATDAGAGDRAAADYAEADRLLPAGSADRRWLDFRWGLLAENIHRDRPTARRWYQRAHEAADTDLLRSYTWRHLASVAADDGDLAAARHGYAESLRLRERCGFLVGIAPALVALAGVSEEPEAGRLRGEAARLVRALGGVPAWLNP